MLFERRIRENFIGGIEISSAKAGLASGVCQKSAVGSVMGVWGRNPQRWKFFFAKIT